MNSDIYINKWCLSGETQSRRHYSGKITPKYPRSSSYLRFAIFDATQKVRLSFSSYGMNYSNKHLNKKLYYNINVSTVFSNSYRMALTQFVLLDPGHRNDTWHWTGTRRSRSVCDMKVCLPQCWQIWQTENKIH